MENILIYGAYGYTGQLISRLAKEQGLPIMLAGRDESRTKALAEELDVPYSAFPLSDQSALDRALQQVKVLLHCAGPFEHTCQVMADACLRNRVHYTDITGEMQVFEYFKNRSAEAMAAGIVFLPGIGFDVVPSDCLANLLAAEMPNAESLTLALFSPGGKMSHGTALTVLENANRGGAIRQSGKIKKVPHAYHVKNFDFGFTERLGVTIPWGDLSTAYSSTGIPNIRVYNCVPTGTMKGMKWLNYTGWMMSLPGVKNYLRGRIKDKPAGPSAEHRDKVRSYIWAEVTRQDQSQRAYLDLPEGYALTAMTSVHIAKKLLEKHLSPGYHTPATAFGPGLILELPGVSYIPL